MITCDVIGAAPANPGLGNQLFTIAATVSLALDNDAVAVFPDLLHPPYRFYGETIFHKLNHGTDKGFVKYLYQEEPYTSTIFNKIPYIDGLCLRGYFQSYKYFYHNLKKIRELFVMPQEILETIDEKYNNVFCFDDSVSLHVRRGDYVKMSDKYTSLGDTYYNKALSKIEDYSKVIVFSDDIDWCRKEFLVNHQDRKRFEFIDGELDVTDLYLMSKIKNNIIANSTFSWWGAMLNSNEDKQVIAPWEWFGPSRVKDNRSETTDLIPAEWKRI